jgi:hypothetical protein
MIAKYSDRLGFVTPASRPLGRGHAARATLQMSLYLAILNKVAKGALPTYSVIDPALKECYAAA